MKRLSRLIWSPSAEEDLFNIGRYYARVASPEVATKLLEEIDRASGRPRNDPLLGRLRLELLPELQGGLRSIIAHPYAIFYQLRGASDERDVYVLRVLHARGDLQTILSREDDFNR